MSEVYVVTGGSYSDYHIKAVFSTEELAKKFIEPFPKGDADIETWKIDEPLTWPPYKRYYQVVFDRDGKSECEIVESEIEDAVVQPYGDTERMRTRCWARDRKHAIKIANERRAQTIANGEWETDWTKWYTRERAKGNIHE